MADKYAPFKRTASRLLSAWGQGTVTLVRTTSTANATEPWNATETTTTYTLDATVRRVEQKYVNGTTIVGTEDQVTFAVPEVTPQMGDKITVDGVTKTIKDLRPIPAAGTPVAYIAFCEA